MSNHANDSNHPTLDYTVGEHTLHLRDGESIPNPARTHRRVYGPCVVHYHVYDDGGLDARVTEEGGG